jgi:sugar lactone lactonase YvrE
MLAPVSAQAARLAFDAVGNLFLADGPSVFKYTRDGTKSTFAAGLKGPLGLCFDSKGDLFVSDVGSHSILKFTPDGKKSTFASGLKAYEMAVDGAGNLFVSDLGSHSIFKFTPEGKKSPFATGLACYDGLAFDNSGNLFVCDNVENSIFKFTPEGTKSTFASGLSSPWGLAVDRAGNLFLAEQDSHSILKFSPDGSNSTFASGLSPYDVAFDPSGNLFVRTGNTMFKFTPDGTKSTFAWMQVSPDNQWEYQCSDDGERAGIVKAGTTETVLDLSEDLPNAALLWAPDSKRFAVNSRTGHSHTTALYQLRGDKWVELRSPEDETSKHIERAESAQLRKTHSPKNASRKHFGDGDEVRKWADANTAILYAYSDMVVGETPISAHFLFTLKFDTEGNWKIVKTHQMSDKEIEKEQ